MQPQAAILDPAGPSGYCIELDFASGDALAALERITLHLPPDRCVLGVGAPLAQKLGLRIPGLRALEPHMGKASLAAQPHDLLLFLTADSAGDAFDRADALAHAAKPEFEISEHVEVFRYRDGRDLTGFLDGIGNPQGIAAARAAIIDSGPLAGGSFAFVQRFLHDRTTFDRLSVDEQDDVIGRTKTDGVELEDAPATAHVKRVDQEGFDPPMFILRKSMPWGNLERNGLQFVAFTNDLDHVEKMLHRMVGEDDGVSDSLLRFTRAETGAYYFCPPLRAGRYDLSALGT